MSHSIGELLTLTDRLWKPKFDEIAKVALVKASRKLGVIHDFSYLADRTIEKFGCEHNVWIEKNPQPGETVARVYKATKKTKSGGFGFVVDNPKEPAKPYKPATAIQYLQRLLLLNYVFKNFVRLEGVWIPKWGAHPCIVTSQSFVVEANRYDSIPRIDVEHEAETKIRAHLGGCGFVQPENGENLGLWTRLEPNGRTVVLADIYARNVILTEEGHPAIVDALAQMY